MNKVALSLLAVAATISMSAQSGPLDFDAEHPPESVCRAAARNLQEVGTSKLLLQMTLDSTGRVQSFKTESPKGLRLEKTKEAATAIKALQFKPAIKKDGSPAATQIEAEFNCADSPAYRTIFPKVIQHVDPILAPRSTFSDSGGRPVLVQLTVQTDGVPRDVTVTKGVREDLDQSTLDAVRQWRFQPATRDGKPVEQTIVVEVVFPPY
jgi:TonB family protein